MASDDRGIDGGRQGNIGADYGWAKIGMAMDKATIRIVEKGACDCCGAVKECAEIEKYIYIPDKKAGPIKLTSRIVICERCWAQTFRQFQRSFLEAGGD